MRKLSLLRVNGSWNFVLATSLALILSACGKPPYDFSNETDRKAAIFDIRSALTVSNCATALDLSKQLFESQYSNNEIRMLYASSHGCNVGIRMFSLIDSLTTFTFSTPDSVFKALVQLFPSRTSLDSRLQSTAYAQDALHTILKSAAVIASVDQYSVNAYNTASVLSRDRTDDGNAFLVFTSMAAIGTSLNRYGYLSTDDPAALAYAQSQALPWLTRAAIKADSSHDGCALASGMLNMLDSMNVLSTIVSGSLSNVFSSITGALSTAITTAGDAQCAVDGGTPSQCAAAAQRLRYRGACFEDDNAASYAAGVNGAIDTGWL